MRHLLGSKRGDGKLFQVAAIETKAHEQTSSIKGKEVLEIFNLKDLNVPHTTMVSLEEGRENKHNPKSCILKLDIMII